MPISISSVSSISSKAGGGYYRYECMDCGRWLKIASGILVALTDTEAEAYLDRKRQRQKGEENGQR